MEFKIDYKRIAIFVLLALAVLALATPASAWWGGFGCSRLGWGGCGWPFWTSWGWGGFPFGGGLGCGLGCGW